MIRSNVADDVLVNARNVSKAFCRTLKRSLWYGIQDIAAELLIRDRSSSALRRGEFWALDDVSFEIRRGECLGLIGHNGAGKTTLLKLLSGLMKPDRGRIEMRGRIGALIELGTGSNPVLTGRENIYVSAAVHGLSKRETDEKLDSIIDFADLGDFIDAPVQSYSSGMKMRLGFAVASHLDPDVLLIDEVMAVGDASFRVKCYNKIDQLRDRCATVFVSHVMPQVARLAERSIVLQNGKVICEGRTSEAINLYYETLDCLESERLGTGEARIREFEFLQPGATPSDSLQFGSPVSIRLRLVSKIEIPSLVVDIGFHTMDGTLVAECNNFVRSAALSLRAQSEATVEVSIPALTLNPGRYRISALLLSEDMTRHFDWIRQVATVTVAGGRPSIAGQQFVADWKIRQ